MVEEAILWTKLGHLSIGFWTQIQWFNISLLGALNAGIYVERLVNRKRIWSLCSRVMHLEVLQNMKADSFIQVLRRFIAHRGNIRLIRCDNGTNFVGAKSELQKCLSEMDEDKISHFLQKVETDWVTWKNNRPSGSYMEGVWECQIKSAIVILSALLKQHGTNLNNEWLITNVELWKQLRV